MNHPEAKALAAAWTPEETAAMPILMRPSYETIILVRALEYQELLKEKPVTDPVTDPAHYTAYLSGVECIQITEHMGFCLGNAVKYIWRADMKANGLEDLRKARWYLDREIERRETSA